MTKWTLEDRGSKPDRLGEVYVLDDECGDLKKTRKWLIYSTPKVEFRLIQEMCNTMVLGYDEDDNPILDEKREHKYVKIAVPKKTLGYLFRYNYEKPYAKFSTFNSFGILYSKKERVCKSDVDLTIIYEDKIVRLLAYEHKNKIKDYWLIGRWRSDNSSIIEDSNA